MINNLVLKYRFILLGIIIFFSNFLLSQYLESTLKKLHNNSINFNNNYSPIIIEKEIKTQLQKTYLKNISNVVFFLYTDNYSKRSLYNSSSYIKLDLEDISNDSEYQLALDLHKYNLCYSSKITELNNNSKLTAFTKKEISSTNIESSFYISCPVFVDNILIGYVSSILYKPNQSLYTDVNKLNYIAKSISNIVSYNILNDK